VPHRTKPAATSPWVAPGIYSMRLTVDGQVQTQPITVKLDPRVKVTPEVQQIFTLTAQMEAGAMGAASTYQEARALLEKRKARTQSSANDALMKQLEALAPAAAPAVEPGPAAPADLSNIGSRMVAAAQGLQESEMAPTATQLQACEKQQTAYRELMAKWTALKIKTGTRL